MEIIDPKISVIIPVYNCEDYLQDCLNSIYEQTYKNYEIIAINDGSTDDSLAILKRNARSHNAFKVIDQENKGQGHARNRAVKIARGEYIQFVDSDDKIDPLTFELAVARADKDQSDLVHYDWKLLSLSVSRPSTFVYYNQDPFHHKYMLKGSECDELMRIKHYFSVNNLYRRSFIIDKKITYGEVGIYEDIVFIVRVANSANSISILHSPLYIVRRNMTSTTRTGHDDDRHAIGYINAIKNSLYILNPRTKHTNFYLLNYFQEKFIVYYMNRIPKGSKKKFLKDFVDAVYKMDVVIPGGNGAGKIISFCIKNNVYSNRRYSLFKTLVYYRRYIRPRINKIKRNFKKLRSYLKNKNNKKQKTRILNRRSIVFLGFDFRYTGNSRYLFEALISSEHFESRNIWFSTLDDRVDKKYKLIPESEDFFNRINEAELIIAESWIPAYVKKYSDTIILQLWHGTALKKLLFDSNESEIIGKNPRHKLEKYKDILRWDYLLVDSDEGAARFRSAFLFPEHRLIRAGYPRVKYLIDNIENKNKKQLIKIEVGFSEEQLTKKVVLYAPTWRDYNYGISSENQDMSYIIDLEKLAERLGDDYIILYNDHHYLSAIPAPNHPRCINVSANESQEILLISDFLVSDYSSIIYDAFAVNIPVAICAPDYDVYQKSRGVYDDAWDKLRPFVVYKEDDLVKYIKNFMGYEHKINLNFLETYTYHDRVNIIDFISELNGETIERDW
ncbi:MAG: CDP-glycerol glycerophosphotransferase family protein [Parahaliea sp.]